MKLIVLMLTLLCIAPQQAAVEFSTKSNSEMERRVKEQMESLVKRYDLSKWYFTSKVAIEDNVIPHSHPVLTLSTRHVRDDDLAISTFVHEQLHWWVTSNEAAMEKAIADLKVKYPNAPIQSPHGSGDERGTYSHIVVCFLEGSAMRQLFGELKAWQIMKFWEEDHYFWIYKTVNTDASAIAAILRKHKLFPPAKPPATK